jgi:hypothetical protein
MEQIKNTETDPMTLLLMLFIIAILHYIYTFYTLQTTTVTIKNKYILYDRLYKLMVASMDGRQLNVGNNIWFWQWKAVELWDSLKEGQTYNVTTFGLRIPILDVFPVIIKINKKK